MKTLDSVILSGREVLPIVEGGKGVSVSNGRSAGAFAASGAVGTFSGVNADSYDANGKPIPQVYKGQTRRERFQELVQYAVEGAVSQAKIAYETASGRGRLHMNTLWEAGGTEEILHRVLERTKGMVDGITCGAGLPYKMAEIAAKFGVFYYPIVSSARAFKVLWRRSYHKNAELLGGVVYEDPWLAGGHNGLSNVEDPLHPENPYPRVRDLRTLMNTIGLERTPIIMAGGVWYLRDWEEWLGNSEIGPIAFQFGSRPLLTEESPISDEWKRRLPLLKEGDVSLNKFSPTGFYSSAVNNSFLQELKARSSRQVAYVAKPTGDLETPLPIGKRGRPVYMTASDKERAEQWLAEGHTETIKTPDSTLLFVDPEKAAQILEDQQNCMGCLSACNFSNWSQNEEGNTGRRPDPRSFCIQKTLQSIAHGADPEHELMFAGHNAYKFGQDPFFADGFIPTVAQLVDRIKTGD
ncbi:MAG: NAD(P)H-dependent flavin oxidoreductase [Magnetospiraceae bacterium]